MHSCFRDPGNPEHPIFCYSSTRLHQLCNQSSLIVIAGARVHSLYFLYSAVKMFAARRSRSILCSRVAVSKFHSTPRAFVKVGDAIPDVDLMESSPGNKVNLSKVLTGKGLIIGVPAAFSKQASKPHVKHQRSDGAGQAPHVPNLIYLVMSILRSLIKRAMCLLSQSMTPLS